MAYVVLWVQPGQSDKSFEVFPDRRAAEDAALKRRREGFEAHVVSTSLAAADGKGGVGPLVEGSGGFRS